MHPIQKSILQLLEDKGVLPLHLHEIGRSIGIEHPQKIKHHLEQLEKKDFLTIDLKKKIVRKKKSISPQGVFISLPILGAANCGEATLFANGNIEGMLKISRSLLKRVKENLFVLRASGDSMNAAEIDGKTIESGDYIVVEADTSAPEPDEYIVSLIDGCANIKKFIRDHANNQAVLLSESTEDYPPIYINEADDYAVAGRVLQVLKRPKV